MPCFHPVHELCRVFSQVARGTWRRLARACNVDIQLGETTCTDLVLLGLQQRAWSIVNATLTAHRFSARQEFRTGADIEIWVRGFRFRWLGLRLQCKVIDIRTWKFQKLFYRSARSRQPQYQLMLQSCLGQKSRWQLIPLFRLYVTAPSSSWWAPFASPTGCCCTWNRSLGREAYGCSVLSPVTVASLSRSNKSDLMSVGPHLVPWHLLFCCRYVAAPGDLAQALLETWRRRILQADRDVLPELRSYEDLLRNVQPAIEPPSYVAALIEGRVPEVPPGRAMQGLIVIQQGG